MHTALMNTPLTPYRPARVRLTISVPAHVHQVYQQMAEATGRSIGYEMGEWLDATLQAAEHSAKQIAAAREAPRQAVQRIEEHMRALQTFDEVAREAGRGVGRPTQEGGARRGSNPPASNTGGKGRKTPTKGSVR